VRPQPAAHIEPITARHHDIQQEQRRRLPFGIRNNIGRGMVNAGPKTSGF